MYQHRVTKYDPKKRDRSGKYTANEWTSRDQIGQTFGGVMLTAADYQKVEDAYVTAAMAFFQESGGKSLAIIQLENHAGHKEPGLHQHQGGSLDRTEIERVCRLNLREVIWCKLEDDAGRFIHFGYDYYMYVGVPTPCESAKSLAQSLGLFVEIFASPYRGAETT
jgi:hypothetical protein